MLLLLAVSASASWTITIGGDVMLNGIPIERRPLERIAELLQSTDVAIANLEIPLTEASEPTVRKTPAELRAKSQFILRAHPAHAAHLKEVGLDALTLANNHMMDYREPGMRECIASLERAGLQSTGAGTNLSHAQQPAVLSLPTGRKLALMAVLSYVGHRANWKATPATPSSPGVAAWSFDGSLTQNARASVRADIKRCREKADFVAVAIHTGLERKPLPTPYQVALGRACVEEGADLVVMHHPHVLQGAELYKGRPILYSVGNLVSALPGSAALFHLRFREDGRILAFRLTPCRITGGRVLPLAGKEATKQRTRFDQLSLQLAKRYPHPEATPLPSNFRAADLRSAILGHGL